MSHEETSRLVRLRRYLALVPLMAVVACGAETPIRIGLAGPFGEPRGSSMRMAAELAIREINASGGIGGRPVELVIRDDSASAARAVAVARGLAADPSVVAVVGHLTSGATLAAAPAYGGTTPVALVSPSASSPLLTTAGPWVFRVCPTDLAHGSGMAAWALDRLGARRAAVLYRNDEYGRGVREVFAEAFAAGGGTVVSDDPYLDDLPSFLPYLERLQRRGGADVIVIAGSRAGAERILSARDALGLRAPVMGGDGLAGLEQAGPPAEGVYVSTAYLPEGGAAANAAFLAAYRAVAGPVPPDHRGAGTYDAVRLIARAVEAVGPDRARIREWLAGVGTAHPAFEGVTGRIAFDEHGDVPDKATVIGVVRDGVLRRADDR